MHSQFKNRAEAGKQLAGTLERYKRTPSIVFALPRGGVLVAAEVARALELPLDLVIVRKIGHPGNPEYALAVVSESGEVLTNPREPSPVSESWFDREVDRGQKEAKRRRKVYCGGRERRSAKGKNAIVVDDGVATGLSLRLALKEIKFDVPWKTIVAVPVAPAETALQIHHECDELEAIILDDRFRGAVAAYYDDFHEVTDEEVTTLLKEFGSPEKKKKDYKGDNNHESIPF